MGIYSLFRAENGLTFGVLDTRCLILDARENRTSFSINICPRLPSYENLESRIEDRVSGFRGPKAGFLLWVYTHYFGPKMGVTFGALDTRCLILDARENRTSFSIKICPRLPSYENRESRNEHRNSGFRGRQSWLLIVGRYSLLKGENGVTFGALGSKNDPGFRMQDAAPPRHSEEPMATKNLKTDPSLPPSLKLRQTGRSG